MRITSQLLRSRAKRPLQSTEYIDLSCLDIVAIERLGQCQKLQTLVLRDNSIGAVENLSVCPQLWKLDLGNNRITSLDGLSRFVAMGSLVLSNNDLTWKELAKMRHMHILDLSLHGNPHLEKDPYYRIHVIDCLPNVWMLDGRIITTAERLQVEHFFQDSALQDHPVRHKLSRELFIPSSMKKIEVNGIFGKKTSHLMARFPLSGAKNIDTDNRRLKYLAFNLQRDLLLEVQHTSYDPRVALPDTFLEDLLDARPADRERCNMLLLLLVASLEFVIPTFLMNETLETAKLSVMGYVPCMDLFLLPRKERCKIVSILLSAVKVDRDEKEDGGLYDRLYLCLYYTVSELNKRHLLGSPSTQRKKTSINPTYREYKCLLAAEVIQLLCIVPAFFDYIERDNGVISLLIIATGDSTIVDRIGEQLQEIHRDGADVRRIYEDIAETLLEAIQQNAKNVLNRQISPRAQSKYLLTNGLPNRPHSSPIYSPVYASDYHTKGRTTPDHRRVRPLTARSFRKQFEPKTPSLGDRFLVGPQNVGYIIALPEPDIALIQMDGVPAANGAVVVHARNMDVHYSYMDMKRVEWDDKSAQWRPKGTVGDRITIQKFDGDDDNDPPNPPTTPTHHGSTQSLSLCTVDDDDRDSMKGKEVETPRPMSAVLQEKLDLKLNLNNDALRSSLMSRDIKSAQVHEDVDKLLGRSKKDEEKRTEGLNNHDDENLNNEDDDAVSVEHLENALYDCLKDAMETVKINEPSRKENENTNRTSKDSDLGQSKHKKEFRQIYNKPVEKLTVHAEEEKLEKPRQEKFVIDVNLVEEDGTLTELSMNERKSRPMSSRPVSGMTERALDDIMLDEMADVNSTISNTTVSQRKGSLESNEDVELKSANAQILTSINIDGGLRDKDSHERQNSTRSLSSPTRLKSARPRISSARSTSTQRSLKSLVSQQTQPIMNIDITRPDSSVLTDYQLERTEAWKKCMPVTPSPRLRSAARSSPPPQRPSSPLSTQTLFMYKVRPTEQTGSVLSVKSCNDWLGCGRNLHYNSRKMRPKSGHVPGYLEGIEPRRQSIQASKLKRSKSSNSVSLSRRHSSSDTKLHRSMDLSAPDYSRQAHQHNFTTRQLGTPPYGAPKRPPSPLNMTFR
ncbi:uncharacterized protein LOC144436126 [Glandiceps talaboti]